MPIPAGDSDLWSLVSLRDTRRALAPPRYRLLVAVTSITYAIVAMIVGGMLYIATSPFDLHWFFYVYPKGPGPTWSYPAIVAGCPYFFLDLPLLSGILMTLVSAGIGLGMALGILLGARLLRQRGYPKSGPATLGTAAGLTPAMIALVTLGACCSTTAAATAGIGLVAQSSGTSPAEALANAWYLGVFQVAVVYVALLAQEQLLRIYRFAVEPYPSTASLTRIARSDARRVDRGSIVRGALRILLVAVGLTWLLSVLTLGFVGAGARPALPVEVGGLLQHAAPGLLAVVGGLFPERLVALWAGLRRKALSTGLRASIVVLGASLVAWIPPPWSGPGFCGFANELLGFAGFPPGWGAVTPPAIGSAGLIFRWSFQFLLLGLFAVAVGLSPEAAIKPLVRASSEPISGRAASTTTSGSATPSDIG